jgi:hypothetical protein
MFRPCPKVIVRPDVKHKTHTEEFVHFNNVHHFHYTYVPAGAPTLKYFATYSPCFNTKLLKTTSNLHPKCI